MKNFRPLSKHPGMTLVLSATIWTTECSVMPAFGPSYTIVDAAHNNRRYRDKQHEYEHYAHKDEILTTLFQMIDVSSTTLPIAQKLTAEQFSAPF